MKSANATVPAHGAKLGLGALLGLGLAACGGGGGGGGGGGTDNPPGTLTGVFVDAPVAALTYACGTSDPELTNGDGEFLYNEGETCTFSAGNLELGTVLAQATVTPRELAAAIAAGAPEGTAQSIDTIAQNLYQLLQSLDADGDTSNGIELPDLSDVVFDAGLTDAVALLNQPADDFQADVAAVVEAVLADQPELPLEVVSVEAALQHAVEQSNILLSGTWIASAGELTQTVTFLPNGTFLFGGVSDDDTCVTEGGGASVDTGGNGAEYGRFDWNPLDGSFVVSDLISDSTGPCGLSELDAPGDANLQVVGSTLRLDVYDTPDAQTCVAEGGVDAIDLAGERTCRYELTRALGTAPLNTTLGATRGLEGSYILESDLGIGIASVLTLEQTATDTYRYLLVESYGNNNTPDDAGATDGIAIGTFTVGSGDLLTVNETLNTIGGDGGLSTDVQPGLAASLDANRNLLFDDEEADEFVYVRLPVGPRVLQAQVIGTYFPRELTGDPSGTQLDTQATEAFPAFLTMFENGEFLLGTNENDDACESDSTLGNTKPLCDGIEYGRYTLDTLTGEVLFDVSSEDVNRPYADSNGINGFLADGMSRDRFFLRPLEADGEVLLVGYVPVENDPIANEDLLISISGISTVAQAASFTSANPDNAFFLVLRPVVSNSTLEGAWQLTAAPSFDGTVREDGSVAPVVVVFQNGDEFFLTHPSGTEIYDGIEFGLYEIDGGNTLCITGSTVDTLPDAGVVPDRDENGLFNVDENGCLATDVFARSADGEQFTLGTGDALFTFTRISEPSMAATP